MTKKAKLGLGCYFSRPVGNPEDIIRAAVESGIRIFDTSPAYGDSEIQVGTALSNFDRSELVYSTKTKALTLKEFRESFVDSLKRLKTEYVDMMWGHSFIDSLSDLEAHEKILAAIAAYKHLGFVRFVGVSGHSAEAANKAIERYAIDAIMVPHSIAHRRFDSVIERARNAGIIVVTMKNFASGILLGGFERNDFNAKVSLRDIMNFSAYSADVVIPSARSVKQLNEIVEAHNVAFELDDNRVLEIERQILESLGNEFCRSCNECRPCVRYGWQMSQSGILRAMLYQEKFGIDMKDVYASFKLNVLDCDGCDSLCSATCSYGIDIKAEMTRAHALFTKTA